MLFGGTDRGRGRFLAELHHRYDIVRWLEYSGLLVVLGLLADASDFGGLSATGIMDLSGLCSDTVYSALAIAIGLGLAHVQTEGRGPMTRTYLLTDSGFALGEFVQGLRERMKTLQLPTGRVPREVSNTPEQQTRLRAGSRRVLTVSGREVREGERGTE
jgi:hypothetical protein